jgi:hypothetical protein
MQLLKLGRSSTASCRVPISLLAVVVVAVATIFAITSVPTMAADEAPAMKQIALTDAHVTGYLKAAAKLAEVAEKVEKADGKVGAKIKAELETIAKASGFGSYDELQLAAENISFVLSGMDDQSGKFREPSELLKLDLEDVKADKSMKKKEKAETIADIKEQLASTPKLEQRGNIAVIKNHLKALAALSKDPKDN